MVGVASAGQGSNEDHRLVIFMLYLYNLIIPIVKYFIYEVKLTIFFTLKKIGKKWQKNNNKQIKKQNKICISLILRIWYIVVVFSLFSLSNNKE